ncbi:MAG: hypothetical protein K8U57_23685 [Planctomycetes bacterium]|nr:hypothetical protein [Planctomycetota bacterium]
MGKSKAQATELLGKPSATNDFVDYRYYDYRLRKDGSAVRAWAVIDPVSDQFDMMVTSDIGSTGSVTNVRFMSEN